MTSKLPTHNGPPKGSAGSEAPCPTLYVQNLPEKMHKPELRMSLYMLFSTHGPVLDVVAMKTKKMRGQAHIVYRDSQTSTQAMRALQGFEFFGKELKIQYGRGRSTVFTRLEGVYRPNTAPADTPAEQSIFTAPTAASTAGGGAVAEKKADGAANGSADASQGVKRRREEESDQGEAPMEEDDDDVSMEASSDDED